MIITSIKPGNKNNILIYADNKFLISIPREVFLKSNVKVGMHIEHQEVNKLLNEKNTFEAKKKALNLLSYRAHTKKELFEKVKRRLGETSAQEATKKMEEIGLLNDEEYALNYARYLSKAKLYAVKRIKYELKSKGIDKEIISKVLEDSEIDEDASINKIISKKHIENEKDKKRLIAYLLRLGYNWEQINFVLEKLT